MAEVRDLSEAYSWPVSRLADCFGLHRQTLTKRIKQGGLRPSGKWRGNPIYEIAAVAELLFSPEVGPDEDVNFDRDPKARKDWYDSENARLRFEKEQRELIPVSEVEETVGTTFAAIAHLLRSIPDNLERKRGLSAELVELVEREILDVQYTMTDRLSSLADVSDQAGAEEL